MAASYWNKGQRVVDNLYEDTGESDEIERPCARCGEYDTEDGQDACMGYVPGVVSACCGHGVERPVVILRIEFEGDMEYEMFLALKRNADDMGIKVGDCIKRALFAWKGLNDDMPTL